MNWLKKKIDEHNARRTYVDQEEEWTVVDFIFCFIGYTVSPLVMWVQSGMAKGMWDTGFILVPMSIGFGVYLVWHLLFY